MEILPIDAQQQRFLHGRRAKHTGAALDQIPGAESRLLPHAVDFFSVFREHDLAANDDVEAVGRLTLLEYRGPGGVEHLVSDRREHGEVLRPGGREEVHILQEQDFLNDGIGHFK